MFALRMSRIGVFNGATGTYTDVDNFKVVEVGSPNGYLVSGAEVKDNLRRYKAVYTTLAHGNSEEKPPGWSNFDLGEQISSYMLESANDTFYEPTQQELTEEPPEPESPRGHPDYVVERRFFAVMRKSDKLKLPEQREIFGLAELNILTTKGKSEVDVVQVVVHPETQASPTLRNQLLAQNGAAASLPSLKGVGTFLTIHSMRVVSKGADVRVIRTHAVNPRSANIAAKFGAKLISDR